MTMRGVIAFRGPEQLAIETMTEPPRPGELIHFGATSSPADSGDPFQLIEKDGYFYGRGTHGMIERCDPDTTFYPSPPGRLSP